jgi:uncharacterized protein (DUF362 family)
MIPIKHSHSFPGLQPLLQAGTAFLYHTATFPSMVKDSPARVLLSTAADRSRVISDLVQEFDLPSLRDAVVAIKGNFNSADPFPATTHPETLASLIREIQIHSPREIVLAERSGMGATRQVLQDLGILPLADAMNAHVKILDTMDASGWEQIQDPRLHWTRGFAIARLFREADVVIQTCCLKTHRFGGHFTMSLKNSVGLVARRVPGDPHDYMGELHSSPHQRRMIAEINAFYPVHMVLMDATLGFATGGPEQGVLIQPGLFLASSDRVALDAVGVALLRLHGSTPQVMQGPIFGLEQIGRAAVMGVGVKGPDQIEIVSLDEGSQDTAKRLEVLLKKE